MATKSLRCMISVGEEMSREMEAFRFERRFPTRLQAAAELIRLGLEVVKQEKMTPKAPKDR